MKHPLIERLNAPVGEEGSRVAEIHHWTIEPTTTVLSMIADMTYMEVAAQLEEMSDSQAGLIGDLADVVGLGLSGEELALLHADLGRRIRGAVRLAIAVWNHRWDGSISIRDLVQYESTGAIGTVEIANTRMTPFAGEEGPWHVVLWHDTGETTTVPESTLIRVPDPLRSGE